LTDEVTHDVDREQVSALILAAGSGTRFGQSKAFLEFNGKTLLEHSVELATMFAAEVLVGLSKEDLSRVPQQLRRGSTIFVTGGATRHATLETLLAQATRPLVLLHEVARPLAPPALFADVLQAAQQFGAAAPCLVSSSRDSVALEEGGFLAATLPRDKVVQLQTPQAYRRELLVEVFHQSRALAVQEPSSVPTLCHRLGYRVRLLPASWGNLKITFPEDWDDVQSQLAKRN
jgi:2-C-methyl-D-erythritol 4-phosphate cytidylyltransferase